MLHLLLPIRQCHHLRTFAEDQEEVLQSSEICSQMAVEQIASYTRILAQVDVEQMMTFFFV